MKKSFIIFAVVFLSFKLISAQSYNDAALKRVAAQDQSATATSKGAGDIPLLPVAEHLYRADVYMSNRHFPEARVHWQKIVDNYYEDRSAMPRTLFGIARSYMWELEYQKAVFWFDRLTKDYLDTKEGREGLAFKAATYVRWRKNDEAAKTYQLYVTMFPTGERIETSYLNLIDALREIEKYDEANLWIDKAVARFGRMPAATNALQSRLRLELFRKNFSAAIAAADDLITRGNFSDSMTSLDEAKFLKAVALEKSGKKDEAISVYQSIPDTMNSYFGGLATEKLRSFGMTALANQRDANVPSSYAKTYPAVFRAEVLRSAKKKKIDPRFLLAIMKQESSFRANAKSPSAARGLLQLVFDTALKYNSTAGFPNLQPDDLYIPATNIAIGTEYVADLKDQFGGIYEAIAASYNGGEDNAARWLNRSRPREPGIFAAEVGFAETKNYVFKVMNNYRVYRELYTEDLLRK